MAYRTITIHVNDGFVSNIVDSDDQRYILQPEDSDKAQELVSSLDDYI